MAWILSWPIWGLHHLWKIFLDDPLAGFVVFLFAECAGFEYFTPRV
jgi:hypothetical protein